MSTGERGGAQRLRVLVACEFSGTVRDAFAESGHDAWSCDLLPSEKPGNHYQGDVFDFLLMGGTWDIVIMHPPCTKIALCGNSTYGKGMPKNAERVDSIIWTAQLWGAAKEVCNKVVMENPKNVMGPIIGKRTQVIHPYEYGHPEQKETWLWLHGLPPLVPTNNVYQHMMTLPRKERERLHFMSPNKDRGHERSRFFQGWADAMAAQWGSL